MYILCYFRAASIAQSASDKRPKLVIWPEWNDTDVNAEKWVSFIYTTYT